MVTDDLIVFINNQLRSGIGIEKLRKILLSQGWSNDDIDLGLAKTAGTNDRLSSPIELLKRSWKIFRTKFRKFIGLALYGILLNFISFLIIVAFVLIIALIDKYFGITPDPGLTLAISAVVGIIFFFISMTVIQTCIMISYLLCIEPVYSNFSAQDIFKKAKSKLLGYFWLSFLFYNIVLAGYILFLLPGLIITAIFSFSFYLLIFENISGTDALYASRQLVKGRFLAVTGRLVSILLFTWAFSLLANLLTRFIPQAINPEIYTNPVGNPNLTIYAGMLGSFLNLTLSLFSGFIVTPLTLIYHVLLYRELKENYAGSFPVPSRKTKRLLLITPVLMTLFIIAVFGYVATKVSNPVILAALKNQFFGTKIEEGFNIKKTPSPSPSPEFLPSVTPDPYLFDINTYIDSDCGYSLVYSGNFNRDSGDHYYSVDFTDDNDNVSFSVLCQEKINPPEFPPGNAENWYLDGVRGTLYLDIPEKDGSLKNLIIVRHRYKNYDIKLESRDDSLLDAATTFKFLN